ncbi:hypothetical protein U6B65_13855 [Oscillospiraceae bacterium MB08-C2-2]|nr:hypothetical protein U6B65_13855 [Oscillospiraceae bacterium MB08-C2-2]
MAIRELQPRLQLSFHEFAETWCTLIEEFHSRGMHADIVEAGLRLSEEEQVVYAAELAAVLLFIAMESWNSRKRVSQDIRGKSTQAIVESLYELLYQGHAEENRELYQSRSQLFRQLSRNSADASPQKRQPELIGFARFLTAQVSTLPEQENLEVIQRLSILFIEASATFFRLASNSFPDLQGFGKTKFIVQK